MALRETITFLEKDLQREFHNIELFHQYEERISDPEVLAKLGLIMTGTLKHIIMLGEQVIKLREVSEGLPLSERKTMDLKPVLTPEELSDAIVEFLKEEETMKVMYKEQAEQVADENLRKVLLAIQKEESEHVQIVHEIIKMIETKGEN